MPELHPVQIPIEEATALAALKEGQLPALESVYAAMLSSDNAKMSRINQLLHAAVSRKHVQVSDLLLQQGAKVNSRSGQGDTPLLVAVKSKHPKVLIQWLLEKGAQVNDRDAETITPLLHAVGSGDKETVELLLEWKANINDEIQTGKFKGANALMLAALRGNIPIFSLLREKKANLVNSEGESPLGYAMMGRNAWILEVVNQDILSHNESIEKYNQKVWERVPGAIDKHFYKTRLFTLYNSHGEPTEEADIYLRTLIKEGEMKVVQAMLNMMGRSYSARYITPAIEAEQLSILQLLLKNTSQEKIENTLYEAILKEKITIAEGLISSHKINIHGISPHGETYLFAASFTGKTKSVQLLLKHKVNVHRTNNNGLTALHAAAEEGHIAIVLELLNHHANIDHPTDDGRTALIMAAAKGHDGVVGVLMNYGANPLIASHEDKTAYDVAKTDEVRFFLDPKNKLHPATVHVFPVLWAPSFPKELRLAELSKANEIITSYARYVMPLTTTSKGGAGNAIVGTTKIDVLLPILSQVLTNLTTPHLTFPEKARMWDYAIERMKATLQLCTADKSENNNANVQTLSVSKSGPKELLDYVINPSEKGGWVKYLEKKAQEPRPAKQTEIV